RILNQVKKTLKDSNILVLGVAYKKNIRDVRESPALDVIKLLQNAGAKVKYNDPHVPSILMNSHIMKSAKLTSALLKKTDCVVIVTDHSAFDYDWIVRNSKLIFDTRNATKLVKDNRGRIIKL
ncbi:MAG: UDP binding domain-containing protein, partial [candidate division Zixibacteria bacterium]|nr:UDP binding domain-containing protein [candidate division Zixibacteria bacterium]